MRRRQKPMKILLLAEDLLFQKHLEKVLNGGRAVPQNEMGGGVDSSKNKDAENQKSFGEVYRIEGELFQNSHSEAYKAYRLYHPDLIFIYGDLNNPSFLRQSIDVCRKVRRIENQRHTGIILLSSTPGREEDLSVTCLDHGADDFLRSGCTDDELRARVKAVLRLKSMTDELRQVNHRLKVLSMTDELTGLPNMRCFSEKISQAWRRCQNNKVPFNVFMMDLDHFKSVNDSANHLIGSYVISEVGKILRLEAFSGSISQGLAARYGGDEYIAYSLGESSTEAFERAEKLRKTISERLFEKDGVSLRITASIGLACIPGGFQCYPEDIIKVADAMLYKSKNDGRDRVNGVVIKCQDELTEFMSQHATEQLETQERVLGSSLGSLYRLVG